eukprot:CAMPEP_0172444392 /NCGR_PEP_ID=MMETSP1065-20121228/4442_1 /TAXON_ID=265537 /ORGANISM="Amphiprora paludosa, Strain CCMP125" /LENGTH=1047 /DNA_ID=CAMNT_0013194915 /DNA_START=254 /DNA_END=3397 /DNA_ORIENTATION=+
MSTPTIDLTLTDEEETPQVTQVMSAPVRRTSRRVAVAAASSAAPASAVTSATATITTASSSPRRSSRVRTSTVLYVGKDAVKKENNYRVQGLTYVHGQFDETHPGSPPTKKPKRQQAPKKAPRVPTAAERMRAQQKQLVAYHVRQKATARRAFLQAHGGPLRPFCEARVVEEHCLGSGKKAQALVPTTLHQQPDLITADMRDYQLQGLEWMAFMHQHNMGMILGDEMGLGKTLQTISLICHLKEQRAAQVPTDDEGRELQDVACPNLVICPLSVLNSWCHEIAQWAPELEYFLYHSSDTEHDAASQFHDMAAGNYDIIVTTYEMIKAPALAHYWTRQYYQLVVLDEGHRIKSMDTHIAAAVRKLHSETRLILTGTPVANHLVELWSLLNFLVPDIFTTKQPFEDAFDLSHNRVDATKLQQAHYLVQVFMKRRLKQEVEKLLPKKIETKICCPLSRTQIWWYKAILLKDINLLARSGGSATHAKLLNNLIMQLRKVCLHPFLFPDAEVIEKTTLEELVGSSGKLTVLDKLLCSLYQKNHRVVLFSQFTSVLDILEDYATMRGWKHCRFDGGTARAKRNFVVNSFNQPNSEKFLFLMSTRSGGMGLNLQTADTCILFDSDWNPQPDIQAMARVHRIGQKKTVHVYRLVTKGTVEERMVERAEKKLYLDRMVTRDGAEPMPESGEMEEDSERLMATLKFGCNAVFGQNQSESNILPTDEDIEVITDRTRTEDYSKGNLKGDAVESAKEFDATKEFTATTKFGGIDFGQIREQYQQKKQESMDAIASTWKRVRKSRIKMLDGLGSGYGSKAVPVLASNDYDLQTGERSVFQRELSGADGKAAAVPAKKKKNAQTFEMQDFCQLCGDGGKLIGCPRCPVALHLKCAGVKHAKELMRCTHHNCVECGKTTSYAGGFLYPCAACPNAYCEQHMPKQSIIMEENEYMEKMGYEIKHGAYILCCEMCEGVAKKDIGWKRPRHRRCACPPALDVSSNFGGGPVDDSLEAPEEVLLPSKRRAKYESSSSTLSKTEPSTSASSSDDDDDVVEIIKVVKN